VPRFVILEHDHPHLHWDLMLEWGDSLRTWRLEKPPVGNEAVASEAIAAHRLAYLDYEGAVSGNRGSVKRWDFGTFVVRIEDRERMEIEVVGRRLRGVLAITIDTVTFSDFPLNDRR